MDRKQQPGAGGATPPPSRRTPVKAPGGGGPPWAAIGIFGGTIAVVLLIVYLVVQAAGDDGTGPSKPEREEANSSSDLPGVYVQSQGRGHFSYAFSLDRTPTPYCEGVEKSEGADPAIAAVTGPAVSTAAAVTPTVQATTAAATSTSAATGAASDGTPDATPTVPSNCYNSNPPSSGRHLNVQRNVDVGNGARINIPPDPDVYPPDVVIPREAIAHGLEHAGVFIGYNCAEGDTACEDVVKQLEDVVNDRIDNHNDRAAMARDPDLPVGKIGLAAWTRVDLFPYADFTKARASDFIGTHSCRFDPENICR
jgi:hypothetical protein